MKQIERSKIKVKPEYKKLVPRMNVEDQKAFCASIQKDGVREPLKLNAELVLLDGHSRFDASTQTKLPYEIRTFENKLLEKKYVIECNLQRRHLTNFQKVELGIPLLEIEKKLAAQRKKDTLKQFKAHKKTPIGSNDPNGKKGKSTEIVADKIGLSNTTMIRGKVVYEKAPEHLKEKLRSGKTSINTVYNHITREQRNLPKVKLPKGSWSVVIVDLPIQFKDKGVRGSSSNNYDTIPIPDLKLGVFDNKNIRDLFNEDCVIFAWFQASTIFYAKEILSAWGFECKTNMIWDKCRIGTGSWLENQHEHLVIATKGKMPIPAIRPKSVQAVKPENRTHSSKPKKFYELIELMYPKRTYLDLFSRYQHNDKWTCFGNQFGEKK